MTYRSSYLKDAIACWGDSLTAAVWPATCGNALGVPAYNGGVGGHASADVAVRQGGLQPLCTLSGGVIPAGSTAPIRVTAITPADGWRIPVTGMTLVSYDFPGTLAGVSGTLSRIMNIDTNGTLTPISPVEWYFIPKTAQSSQVTVPAGTRFIGSEGANLRNRIATFWVGTNNFALVDTPTHISLVMRDIDSMIAWMTSPTPRFLVIGMTFNGTTATTMNNALRSKYGENFVDLRKYLMQNGLAAAGITPTSGDLTDLAANNLPRSIMSSDNLHFNDAGYSVVGKYIATVLQQRTWTTSALYAVSDYDPRLDDTRTPTDSSVTLSKLAPTVADAIGKIAATKEIQTGTTVYLTASSLQTQEFTATSAVTVYLPSTDVVAGQTWTLLANGTGGFVSAFPSSGGDGILTITNTRTATFTARVSNPTTNDHWVYAAISSTATLNSLAQRDSKSNLIADNFIATATSVATSSGGVTTMDINSAQTQYLTGSFAQTVKLPTVNIVAGQTYTIINQSTQSASVQSSAGNAISTVAAGSGTIFLALYTTPTSAAHWRAI